MAITSVKTGSSFTNLQKYDTFLGPNSAYIPSAYESIATVTAAGGEASLSFTSIPSTYKHLQIRGLYRDETTGGFTRMIGIRFNSDSATNYSYHILYGNGSTVTSLGGATSNTTYTGYIGTDADWTSNCFGSFITDITDYASTSKNKTIRTFGGGDDNTVNANHRMGISSGAWFSTSALTSISLTPASTFAAGTTFALYGVK